MHGNLWSPPIRGPAQTLLTTQTERTTPLATALRRKARTGVPGETSGLELASGEGWRVIDLICTAGPHDQPFEERHETPSISLVLSGSFVYRSEHAPASMMSPGALLLGNRGHVFECSHQHGEGDRCLSFQFDPDWFERLADDAGMPCGFGRPRLPPLRELSPLSARAARAMEREESFEEVTIELAGAALRLANRSHPDADATRDPGRIAPVLRRLADRGAEPQPLAELARAAGLSRYHFLRTFKAATGVTPHQWLLRARLRDAARRLATTAAPVTQIALEVGFEDLSNFIRSFRAEFGVSPGRYRTAGAL